MSAHPHAPPQRARRLAAAWLGLLLLAGCGREGVAEYERARAALAAGRLDEAERAMEEAVEAGGADFEPLRSFVRGNVAHARSLALESRARPPAGDPEALKAALMLAEDALARWQAAAASRADWPAARRNAERGLRRLDDLREKRAAAKRRALTLPGSGPPAGAGPDGPPRPAPPPPRDGPDGDAPPAATAAPETADLAPEALLGLLDLVRAKERERRDLRRRQRQRPAAGVERDW